MTPVEMKAAAERESVRLYLKRQELEAARLTIAQQIQQCERELVKLDGRIDALDAVIAATTPQEP